LKPASGHLAGWSPFRSSDLGSAGDGQDVLQRYLTQLEDGSIPIEDLIISKRITREPRNYQKASVTAIAAQQLFGNGIKLRAGETVEYVITAAKARVPNHRVRASSLWEAWHGYDRAKYAAMLREAFEPFERPCPPAG